MASFHVIIALQHNVEINPGPKGPSPKCSECNKTIRSNQKHCVCEFCRSVSHSKCVGFLLKSSAATTPIVHTCNDCLHRVLPFQNHPNFNDSNSSLDSQEESFIDQHLTVLQRKAKLLKFMHINTQSLASTFDEFQMILSKYPFDVVALSETWLTKDKALNDYVQIPGYELVSENRNNMKGGGVGFYVKDSIKFKRRKDIENKARDLEHLWIELPGQNRNSRLLAGVIYRSEKLLPVNDWLEKFEETIAYVKSTWDGPVLIAGDMNINLMSFEDTKCRKYLSMIEQVQSCTNG
eukprot:Seg9174.1 transcript_id=Seg9174.1/GoldUCD/mRNA.D3Y31 product="hypothetical protein" protein_id=Seg9174.1/GoldUCD/D3Y31